MKDEKMAQWPARGVHFSGLATFTTASIQEDMTLAVLGKEPLDELPGISITLTTRTSFLRQKTRSLRFAGENYGKLVLFWLESWNSFRNFTRRRAMVTERFQSVKSTGRRALRGVGDPSLEHLGNRWHIILTKKTV